MNEATLEARLSEAVRKAFPALVAGKISHQNVLTLSLGHRRVAIDGKDRERLTGRLDILVEYDGRALAVLELKAPDVGITDSDAGQGISYARLLTPMPAFVVVTNGADTKLWDVFSGQPIVGVGDEEDVRARFAQAAQVAANERDHALRVLLGAQPDLWGSIAAEHTSAILTQWEGPVVDLGTPVASDFSVPRAVVKQLMQHVAKPGSLCVLIGDPLSGKTNAIAQFCRRAADAKLAPFLFDAASVQGGVLRHLAGVLSRDLFLGSDEDETRKWLLQGGPPSEGLVLVIDGWPHSHDAALKTELHELTTMARKPRFSILLSVDQNTWEMLSHAPGRRTLSAIGRKATRVTLGRLDDEEFAAAARVAVEAGVGFMPGSAVNAEYRQPRILRLVVSTAAAQLQDDGAGYEGDAVPPSGGESRGTDNETTAVEPSATAEALNDPPEEPVARAAEDVRTKGEEPEAGGEDGSTVVRGPHAEKGIVRPIGAKRIVMCPSVSGINLVQETWRYFASDPALRDQYSQLAECLLADAKGLAADSDLLLFSMGRALFLPRRVRDRLGQHSYERLIAEGHLRLVHGPAGRVFALGRFPEAVSAAATSHIGEELARLVRQGQAPEAHGFLLDSTKFLPLSDIAGAMALIEGHARDTKVLMSLIPLLLEDKPEKGTVDAGSEFGMYAHGFGVLRLHFETGGEEWWGNLQSWLILAHLGSMPLRSTDGSADVLLQILSIVGNHPDVLRRPDDALPLGEIHGIYVHEIEGLGSVPCGEDGVIEPITQALVHGIHRMPEQMRRLAQDALEHEMLPLAFRLATAATATRGSPDAHVREAADLCGTVATRLLRDR
jgi:hypothetical protein